MLKPIIESNAARPNTIKPRFRSPLRACAPAVAVVLTGLLVDGPALARTPYDGDWSVLIMTRRGACEPAVRYGAEIIDGRVISPGGTPAAVNGRVSEAGSVRVDVQAGGQWASGIGRLQGNRGSGVWRGQGTSGFCAGTWVAERRGFAPRAATGAPVYNYAPETAAPMR
jgi:hypothetical protein